jgi:hypothetical protein
LAMSVFLMSGLAFTKLLPENDKSHFFGPQDEGPRSGFVSNQ